MLLVLASFKNKEEVFFISSLVSFTDSFWSGLYSIDNNVASKASYVFTDGTNPQFASSLWAPGQPDNTGEACVEMVSWGGTQTTDRLNNLACSTEKPYVCIKTVSGPQPVRGVAPAPVEAPAESTSEGDDDTTTVIVDENN